MASTLPYFHSQGLISTDAANLVKVFPFTTKKRRKSDLLVLEKGASGEVLCLYANPYPISSECDGPPNWRRVKIATTLKKLVGLAHADISKNGYNDVIVVDEHEPLPSSLGVHFGGRISWFENTGLDDCRWQRREIGKFPGAHILKVGHFTNNFSAQVLVVPVSAIQRPCPLVVYTQPPNITTVHQWFSSVTLLSAIHAISDVHVVPSKHHSEGELDKILVTSSEGVSLMWWESSKWHTRPINPTPILGPSLVTVGYIDKDLPAYLVSFEAHSDRTVLSVHVRRSLETRQPIPLQQAQWNRHIIDTFPGKKGIMFQVSCADFDGDGIEEIMVSFGMEPNSREKNTEGIWYYRPADLANGKFEKYACLHGHFPNFAIDDFRLSGKMDIMTTSTSTSPEESRRLEHYSSDFRVPVIQASVLQGTHTLRLSVPNPATLSGSCHELPLFATMATEFTLVVLGPHASYTSECRSRGIKVLYGVVLFQDRFGKSVKRGKAIRFKSRSAMRSLIIEDDDHVTAGPLGAIFLVIVKSRPPSRQIINIIPEPYPSSVRGANLSWVRSLLQEDRSDVEVYTFNAFLLYLLDSNERVAHVHFTAYDQKTQSSSPAFISRGDLQANPTECQIRTCIVNDSGCGGLYAKPKKQAAYNQAYGAPSRRTFVPTMSEVAPEWCLDKSGNPIVVGGRVKYPEIGWVSDVVGKGLGPRHASDVSAMDVWMDVDFPPFKLDSEDDRRRRYRVLWVGASVILILFLLASLHYLHGQWMGIYGLRIR